MQSAENNRFDPKVMNAAPKDYGLEYEDVTFTASDGIKLAAWLTPAEGSDKLIICNHPATLNRYGFPGHLEPWSNFRNVEVKFGKVHQAMPGAWAFPVSTRTSSRPLTRLILWNACGI